LRIEREHDARLAPSGQNHLSAGGLEPCDPARHAKAQCVLTSVANYQDDAFDASGGQVPHLDAWRVDREARRGAFLHGLRSGYPRRWRFNLPAISRVPGKAEIFHRGRVGSGALTSEWRRGEALPRTRLRVPSGNGLQRITRRVPQGTAQF